jgi:hypothetical protein
MLLLASLVVWLAFTPSGSPAPGYVSAPARRSAVALIAPRREPTAADDERLGGSVGALEDDEDPNDGDAFSLGASDILPANAALNRMTSRPRSQLGAGRASARPFPLRC